MAFAWNTYNIILTLAIVIFSVGIMFIGYKIATDSGTQEQMMVDEFLLAQQVDQAQQASKRVEQASKKGTAPQALSSQEEIAEVGGSQVPEKEHVSSKVRKSKRNR